MLYIKLLILIHKFNNKSINDIFKLTEERKKGEINVKRFFKAYHALNKLSDIEYLFKKYNLACLKKSLILFFISKDYGINITFKMGMYHYGRFLSGHAWIEYQDKPLDENLDITKYKLITIKTNY